MEYVTEERVREIIKDEKNKEKAATQMATFQADIITSNAFTLEMFQNSLRDCFHAESCNLI